MPGSTTISAIGRRLTPRSPGDQGREEIRSLLQQRVAWFGLFGGGLGGAFALWRVADAVVSGRFAVLGHRSFPWHVAGAGTLLALGAVCRWGRRSVRFVELVEMLGLVLSCACYAGMGATMPAVARPDWLVLNALSCALVIRAIYVPSSARRSFWLGLLIAAPYLGMVSHVMRELPPGLLAAVADYAPDLDAADLRRATVISSAAWWAATVAISTAASRVIYGLRAEVQGIRRLGQYELEAPLGQGGMGVVYRAKHALLMRPTAVKLLRPEHVGEQSIARFEREVQLTARLSHPNTITVFDYGRTPDGLFYYAMELVSGVDLGEVVQATGPMPAARVLHLLHQAAGSLAEAHDVGLIHRDVKPQNLMLCQRGGIPDVIKVLDFGLVKQVRNPDQTSLTGSNVITGTPQYLAPESLKDPQGIDGRADLYALGAVAYLLLTGREVFEGGTVVEICSHHLHSQPTPPSELVDDLPEDVERLVLACLAKSPDERPAGARALRQALEECRDFGTWTEEHARAWWDEHAADLPHQERLSGLG